jgi:hypothetical protein
MTNIKLKLIGLFTTIAILALPTAEAAARHFGHYS